MPKLVALPVRGYPDIYVNPTRVTLIRESGEAETLVEFEGDKREAIALPIEKVRALIDQAMSTGDDPIQSIAALIAGFIAMQVRQMRREIIEPK
jgi:hypothetical protein